MPDAARPATSPRDARAAAAETSVRGRHLRRLWAWPPARLGVITAPAPTRHRLFVDYNFWWQAHLLDCLVDAQLRQPDVDRRRLIAHLPRGLFVRNRFSVINEYFDDIAWLGLALGRARDEAGVRLGWRDAQIAKVLFDRWYDDAAGGGIPWRVGDEFRNVPANGSMAILMARFGRRRRALAAVEWMYERLFDPDTGMFADGIRPGGVDGRLFTYNQGLVLGALLELVAAGHEPSRERLHALVATIERHCAVEGVLNGCGGGDGGLFAAITARYLTQVALRLPGVGAADEAARATAARLVQVSADAAWRHRAERDGEVWFGPDWRFPAVIPGSEGVAANAGDRSSVPPERDLSVQLGGWMILELAARLDRLDPRSPSPERGDRMSP